jgi:hypothetical protein
VGLSVPLDHVDVADPAPLNGWCLLDLNVGPAYAAALCLERPPRRLRLLEAA